MSHSIAELRQHSPMWYFERNYVALMDMLSVLDLTTHKSVQFELASEQVMVKLVEHTRYTLFVTIQHRLSCLEAVVPDLQFDVRLYLDAQLAEVIGYQGVRYLQYKYPYPNKGMRYPDEKRQTNLMLFDWLCACTRLDFRNAVINTVKPIGVST